MSASMRTAYSCLSLSGETAAVYVDDKTKPSDATYVKSGAGEMVEDPSKSFSPDAYMKFTGDPDTFYQTEHPKVDVTSGTQRLWESQTSKSAAATEGEAFRSGDLVESGSTNRDSVAQYRLYRKDGGILLETTVNKGRVKQVEEVHEAIRTSLAKAFCTEKGKQMQFSPAHTNTGESWDAGGNLMGDPDREEWGDFEV